MFASGNIKEVVFDFKVCISEQSSVDDLLKENHLLGGFFATRIGCEEIGFMPDLRFLDEEIQALNVDELIVVWFEYLLRSVLLLLHDKKFNKVVMFNPPDQINSGWQFNLDGQQLRITIVTNENGFTVGGPDYLEAFGESTANRYVTEQRYVVDFESFILSLLKAANRYLVELTLINEGFQTIDDFKMIKALITQVASVNHR